MNKAAHIFAVCLGILSCLMLCGCSSKDKDNDAGKELKAAMKMFDNWGRGDQGAARGYSRPLTPEAAMGLQKPEDLSPAVYAWIKDTEYGEYYRRSRESLAVLYKKLMDDYRVRNESGVRPTEYTGELMRSWRSAYNADYGLRGLIVESYSRKELLPLPHGLARYFTAEKEARERLRRLLDRAQSENKRLSSELSLMRRELDSMGDVAWSQRKSQEEWRTLKGKVDRLCSKAGTAVAAAESTIADIMPTVRENNKEATIRDLHNNVVNLRNALSALRQDAAGRQMIVDGQMTLLPCVAECAALESELATLRAEMDSAGVLTWADEKDIQTWTGLQSLMSGILDRAGTAKANALELAQKIRPVVRISNGDATVKALGERAEKLYSSLSEFSSLASERRTISEGKAKLAKDVGVCFSLEAELGEVNAAFGNMEPVAWTDEKEIESWQNLRGPTEELLAKATKASAGAAALAKGVKPIVQASNGDKTVVAFDARVEKLNASLSAAVRQASERLAIVKGQVHLSKFVRQLRAMSSEMAKVPVALGKKKARMREIENIERQIRESKTRNYSDLEDLASKTTAIKARSLEERKDEIALGLRVQRMVNNRESVLGSNATYRFRQQVPEKAAHERRAVELEAFKRTLGVSASTDLSGFFANIESNAYRLVDVMEEDAMIQRLEETLRIVQRLAASKR